MKTRSVALWVGSIPPLSRNLHKASLRCSSCWQERTVLAQGVRSPRLHLSSSTRCKVATKARRLGRRLCCQAGQPAEKLLLLILWPHPAAGSRRSH